MNLVIPIVAILLMPLAIAGLALIHQGLGRSRSAAHTMLATLCALAVATLAIFVVGFSLTGFPGGLHHTVKLGQYACDWLGAEPLFARRLSSLDPDKFGSILNLAFYLFAAGLTAIIPISAGSDRWRIAAISASTAVLTGIIWPLTAHATWATLVPSLNLDGGGCGAVQVVGGLAALSVVWILGPRRGKYSSGIASAIPGHNIVQVLSGCLLALVGFIALDIASSSLLIRDPPTTLDPVALAVISTIVSATLAASAGLLAALVTTRIRYRKPDASISANGWIAGLVASSAAASILQPWQAVLTGLVAGILVAFLVEILELRLLIDDPGGAISVHAAAGIWGLLSAALFTPGAIAPQLLSKLLSIATLLGLIFPLIHIANLLLNRFIPFRVDTDGDWQGMDIRELGAGAYPEFVVHADEFVPR